MEDKSNDAGHQATANRQTTTVTLDTPIPRGESEISTLVLRKPSSGELRGMNMQDVLQSDVNSLIKLVPRICTPNITEADLEAMPVDDFAEIGGAVFGFFMRKATHEEISRMTGAG